MGLGATRDPNALVETHRTYAHAIAADVLKKLPSAVERNDIEGWAELGLVQAASSFDPARGVLFKTFAYYRIRGAIYDGIRKMTWFSKSYYQSFQFEMAANDYMADQIEVPVESTNPADELKELELEAGSLFTCCMLSLDQRTADVPSEGSRSPEEQVLDSEDRRRLRDALEQLPEKNRKVLFDYYFEEKSLEEIGRSMNLSKSWVCRIHARSLDMVRDLLQADPRSAAQETFARQGR